MDTVSCQSAPPAYLEHWAVGCHSNWETGFGVCIGIAMGRGMGSENEAGVGARQGKRRAGTFTLDYGLAGLVKG
jgi:hypothetical protein